MPAILCGDFNAEPDSDEIRFLCGLTTLDGRDDLLPGRLAASPARGPGYTQDWRDNPIAADLNVHRKRIDYVFVGDPFRRDGDAGRVLSAALAFDEPAAPASLASDHAGLVVDVVWPDATGLTSPRRPPPLPRRDDARRRRGRRRPARPAPGCGGRRRTAPS